MKGRRRKTNGALVAQQETSFVKSNCGATTALTVINEKPCFRSFRREEEDSAERERGNKSFVS